MNTQGSLPAIANQQAPVSLLATMANRYGMDPKNFEIVVRRQVMPEQHSNEEFAACMLVANQYKLNPFTKEVYFMKTRGGGIQPIVSVDGWVKQANEHPQYDGVDFVDSFVDGKIVCVTCKLFRKDRSRPVIVTEYLSECDTSSPAWKKTPARMLRHRAFMQAIRYAFGFSGVMDRDEFDQWQGAPQVADGGILVTDARPLVENKPAVLDPFAGEKQEAPGAAVEAVEAEPVKEVAPQALLDPFGAPDAKPAVAPAVDGERGGYGPQTNKVDVVGSPPNAIDRQDDAPEATLFDKAKERIKAAKDVATLDKAQAWLDDNEQKFSRNQRDELNNMIADMIMEFDAREPA